MSMYISNRCDDFILNTYIRYNNSYFGIRWYIKDNFIKVTKIDLSSIGAFPVKMIKLNTPFNLLLVFTIELLTFDCYLTVNAFSDK